MLSFVFRLQNIHFAIKMYIQSGHLQGFKEQLWDSICSWNSKMDISGLIMLNSYHRVLLLVTLIVSLQGLANAHIYIEAWLGITATENAF